MSGVITVTGIGARIGDGFARWPAAIDAAPFFTMITSIILGMGVPTTANTLSPRPLWRRWLSRPWRRPAGIGRRPVCPGRGYVNLPDHMFTFYFGIVADITPPVCLAAMAGAAIAKADPIKTGFEATRLAIAAFLIPYMFIFSPQLLMVNAAWYTILRVMATALLGMYGVAMFMQKFYMSRLNIIQQLMALAGV